MSIVETAEQRIKELNGGEFQALAARYVGCKYHIASVHHSGRSFGTVETTVGIPDCFLQKPNGHFIYVECGKRQDRLSTLRKLREDVEHCLDYEKEHPGSGKIDEIVCCYSFPRLTPEDLSDIKKMDDRVTLIGPEEIAQACVTRYPWLAKGYLGLPVGTGAFLDAQAFIERNHNDRFAPDLDQRLVYRDWELAKIREKITRNQVLLLYGPPGCGKTKLALETCLALAAEQEADFYIVTPSRQDIYEDLRLFLSDKRTAYLLLDDANQLAGLRTVVEHVLVRPGIKLIVTCRNYARTSVYNELKRINQYDQMRINPLPTSGFLQVLENEIGENLARKLAPIVKGNLRLGLLAADSLNEERTSITTMKEILEVVYKDRLNDMTDSERKTVAIASILGPHMIADNEQLCSLLDRFGLSHEDYKSRCRDLYDTELMDATPRFEAVNLEEQNLRDYFLYYSLVDASVVQLSDLWRIEGGEALCIRATKTVAATFRDDITRQKLGRQLKELLETIPNDKEALRLIDGTDDLSGRAGFSRLCSVIHALEPLKKGDLDYGSFDFSLPYPNSSFNCSFQCLELSALSHFLKSDGFYLATVGLAFDLLTRLRLTDSDVVVLFEGLLAKSFPGRNNTQIQRETLRLLESAELSDNGNTEAVFNILFAKGLLCDEAFCEDPFCYSDGFGSTLVHTEAVIELRGRCIELLLRERRCYSRWSYQIGKVLLGYRHRIGGDERLSRATYKLVARSVSTILESKSFVECVRLHHFITAALCVGIDVRDSMLARLGEGACFAMEILNARRFSDEKTRLDLLQDFIMIEKEDWRQHLGTELSPDSEVLSALADHATKLSAESWLEFLGLLRADNGGLSEIYKEYDSFNNARFILHDYTFILDKLLAYLLENASLDDSINSLICHSIITSTILLPRTICAYISQYLSCYSWQEGRTKIIDDKPSYICDWLALFDSIAIEKGHKLEVRKLIDSLEAFGEILPFAAVCDMERKSPGGFAPYVLALAKHSELASIRFQAYYVPRTHRKMRIVMRGECGTSENWIAVAKLICSFGAEHHLFPHEGIIRQLKEVMPSFCHELFTSIVHETAGDCSKLDDIFCSLFRAAGVAYVLDGIESVQIDGADSYDQLRECKLQLMASVVECARFHGDYMEVYEWISNRVLKENEAVDSLIVNAFTALYEEARLSMAIRLAFEGIAVPVFAEVVFSQPCCKRVFGLLTDKYVRYCEALEEMLIKNCLFAYLPSAHHAVEQARRELENAHVEEFLKLP